MPSPIHAALYANHRRFLEAQRGPLMRHGGYDVIHGDVRFFQIAMLHDTGALEDAARAAAFVFAPPWAAVAPDAPALSGLSYRLSHMSLPSGVLAPPTQTLPIEIVATEAQLGEFTDVQASAFEPDPAKTPDLRAWMWKHNVAAYRESDQRYYMLRREGRAVSVLLTVESDDALGLYAVATLPEHQKQGLSSQLLAHVAAAETRPVCLQVMRGSAAERLYTKLGFVERFVVDVYASARFGG